jgi:hypothetical protein
MIEKSSESFYGQKNKIMIKLRNMRAGNWVKISQKLWDSDIHHI